MYFLLEDITVIVDRRKKTPLISQNFQYATFGISVISHQAFLTFVETY